MTAFEALAVENRRKIVTLLSTHASMSATDICHQFDISPPAVSQHLKVLREARLVTVVKAGQKRLYRLDMNGIQEMESWLVSIKREWEDRLDSLNSYIQTLKQTPKPNL